MSWREVWADLHVHVGREGGRVVKIAASRALDLRAAVEEASERKGLGVLGLVDCCSGPVLEALGAAVDRGWLRAAPGGGFLAGGLLIVTGCEVEVLVARSPVHCLLYLPDLRACRGLRAALEGHVRRPDLSSQRAHGLDLAGLHSLARRLGGLFGLAHAFTPHRGFYGATGLRLADVAGPGAARPGGLLDLVEMGLSADAPMADLLTELEEVPFLASSDAHGAAAIGREATRLRVRGLGFGEVALAIRGRRGRAIVATCGLDPRLGKYHRSACAACGWTAAGAPGPYLSCPRCGAAPGPRARFVPGVLDRLLSLADRRPGEPGPAGRPPYRYHVPLRFLPGVGPVTAARLVARLGSELHALQEASAAELEAAAGPRLARLILSARRRELDLDDGGGGTFGRVRPAGRPRRG